jgi:hypothetical protein
MLQGKVQLTAVLLGFTFPFCLTAGGYSELLPKSLAEHSSSAALPMDEAGQLKHLLHKHQSELNTCAALANAKKKAYISKTTKVMATIGSAVFRFRKQEGEAPQVQLENVECMSPLVEGCIVGIFKQRAFKNELQDTALDGRIVVDFDCKLDVERNIVSLDEINYQCKAKWDFYDKSAAYPETVLKIWK